MFVLTDMASYFCSGGPSSWDQGMMLKWRGAIRKLLDDLVNVRCVGVAKEVSVSQASDIVTVE